MVMMEAREAKEIRIKRVMIKFQFKPLLLPFASIVMVMIAKATVRATVETNRAKDKSKGLNG